MSTQDVTQAKEGYVILRSSEEDDATIGVRIWGAVSGVLVTALSIAGYVTTCLCLEPPYVNMVGVDLGDYCRHYDDKNRTFESCKLAMEHDLSEANHCWSLGGKILACVGGSALLFVGACCCCPSVRSRVINVVKPSNPVVSAETRLLTKGA